MLLLIVAKLLTLQWIGNASQFSDILQRNDFICIHNTCIIGTYKLVEYIYMVYVEKRLNHRIH